MAVIPRLRPAPWRGRGVDRFQIHTGVEAAGTADGTVHTVTLTLKA